MQNLFCEGLLENDTAKLLEVPKDAGEPGWKHT